MELVKKLCEKDFSHDIALVNMLVPIAQLNSSVLEMFTLRLGKRLLISHSFSTEIRILRLSLQSV